jgi:hypothetical protein
MEDQELTGRMSRRPTAAGIAIGAGYRPENRLISELPVKFRAAAGFRVPLRGRGCNDIRAPLDNAKRRRALPNETKTTGDKPAEQIRLDEAREKGVPWKQWGPYLSERQWGTVREDYSEYGDAWNYFTHDQARSRAYHWGEDGLAGFSDDRQRLCFALALWNGKDAILKERLFGLNNSEGNHGEDVKEYYFYLDSTPTHSYMRYLYKYP